MAAQRLRQRYRQEAQRLMRASHAALPPVRSCFCENGTAYLVREYFPEAKTLAESVRRPGDLSLHSVDVLLQRLTGALQKLHSLGIQHLDLRPSNILLRSNGEPFLIDFGESRKWYRDLVNDEQAQDGLPPESDSRSARMGPHVDIYGLSASLYYALTGVVPPRAWPQFGEMLTPLHVLVPGIPQGLSEAIEKGLRIDPGERPRSIQDFSEIASGRTKPEMPEDLVTAFDQKAVELKQLRFDRRQCPSCRGVLESPKPLRAGVCPVCHEGKIRTRKVVEKLCPHCRMGTLKALSNHPDLSICPVCRQGLLQKRRKGIFSKEFSISCDDCEAVFDVADEGLRITALPTGSHLEEGATRPSSDWRAESGRAELVWHCRACGAQYDALTDGRWRQMVPDKISQYEALEPLEWARVAAGLPPEAGNAECDACGADYFAEGANLTLLESRFDPHHFAERNIGRIVTLEEARWLGFGKESPNPGFVCGECGTELDLDGDRLKIARATNHGMLRYPGQSLSLENWHRAARELPLVGEEAGFEEAFGVVIRDAYQTALLGFSPKDQTLIWKGPAVRFEHGKDGWKKSGNVHLEVSETELTFGGLIKKSTITLDEIVQVTGSGNRLDLKLKGGSEPIAFELEPVDLTVQLESGNRSIRVDAGDLLARLRSELQRARTGEGQTVAR